MKAIVDRFECCFVVIELEDGTTKDVPRAHCPDNIDVGQAIDIAEDGTITIDAARTQALKREIDALADDLFEE
ncbi:DUF3006 domain-containing protein [Kurthia huakuii]|uniref:DUF3006 domain-containing protein n=1 Tax=Kurthia huakuii TaxID=1421019 RepID=UPI000494DAF0|nr:DUF3006 domain-containing protein [Kurthia huakuii]MBM7700134.1 hypothetical protein [Kurthia huakuii]